MHDAVSYVMLPSKNDSEASGVVLHWSREIGNGEIIDSSIRLILVVPDNVELYAAYVAPSL